MVEVYLIFPDVSLDILIKIFLTNQYLLTDPPILKELSLRLSLTRDAHKHVLKFHCKMKCIIAMNWYSPISSECVLDSCLVTSAVLLQPDKIL